MKNPNGYGTIKKLNGNRRRPFAFIISEKGRRRVVSCHATKAEALMAQADYIKQSDRPRLQKMTSNGQYPKQISGIVAAPT